MMVRQTSLSANMVQFCRFLRLRNFRLGVGEEITLLHALQYVDFTDRHIFRATLKCLLCKSHDELLKFDDLFDEYNTQVRDGQDAKVVSKITSSIDSGGTKDALKSLKYWLHGNSNKEIEETASYSAGETLSQQDFALIPADRTHELRVTIMALARSLATQLGRRYQISGKVNIPDLRRSLRKNMRHGGELLHLVFQKPKRKKTKLVILCDVSKSMDLYTHFFLQFIHAFHQVYSGVETFVFGTFLQPISNQIKENDFSNMLQALSKQNTGWSGGTRIGESLFNFVAAYSSRLSNKHTIVIIVSDGWDTGSIDLLEENIKIISKRSRKVIWLNPLLGYASYRPEVAGMKVALPYVDVFAPVHNLESLKNLKKYL